MTPIASTPGADWDKIFGLARQRYGTVTLFARRIGRHRQTLWNARNGNPISWTLLTAIADALGVEAGELLLTGPADGEQEQKARVA